MAPRHSRQQPHRGYDSDGSSGALGGGSDSEDPWAPLIGVAFDSGPQQQGGSATSPTDAAHSHSSNGSGAVATGLPPAAGRLAVNGSSGSSGSDSDRASLDQAAGDQNQHHRAAFGSSRRHGQSGSTAGAASPVVKRRPLRRAPASPSVSQVCQRLLLWHCGIGPHVMKRQFLAGTSSSKHWRRLMCRQPYLLVMLEFRQSAHIKSSC